MHAHMWHGRVHAAAKLSAVAAQADPASFKAVVPGKLWNGSM
ncbi:MAG TPA: hypothetical protein PKH69_06275 [Thiobacillaceae bacterium]|nr:hypothetical protein [Thiobacillaceae bacterium]